MLAGNHSVTRRVAVVLAAAASLIGTSVGAHAQQKEEAGYWTTIKNNGVLRCGAATAAPYVMRDPATGEYSGFFVELCREFAGVLGVKAEFVDTNWDNIVAGLQAGRWDMSMALNRTPTRALAIQYSNAAVELSMNFVYNKNNPKFSTAPSSVVDIDQPGVTVAVMSGSAQDKAISPLLKSATVMRLPGNEEARLAVISKRADLVLDANDTNMLLSEAHPDWAATLDPQPALSTQGVSFGLPHSISYADTQVINIFLEEKIATGHVKQLIDDAVAKIHASEGK